MTNQWRRGVVLVVFTRATTKKKLSFLSGLKCSNIPFYQVSIDLFVARWYIWKFCIFTRSCFHSINRKLLYNNVVSCNDLLSYYFHCFLLFFTRELRWEFSWGETLVFVLYDFAVVFEKAEFPISALLLGLNWFGWTSRTCYGWSHYTKIYIEATPLFVCNEEGEEQISCWPRRNSFN